MEFTSLFGKEVYKSYESFIPMMLYPIKMNLLKTPSEYCVTKPDIIYYTESPQKGLGMVNCDMESNSGSQCCNNYMTNIAAERCSKNFYQCSCNNETVSHNCDKEIIFYKKFESKVGLLKTPDQFCMRKIHPDVYPKSTFCFCRNGSLYLNTSKDKIENCFCNRLHLENCVKPASDESFLQFEKPANCLLLPQNYKNMNLELLNKSVLSSTHSSLMENKDICDVSLQKYIHSSFNPVLLTPINSNGIESPSQVNLSQSSSQPSEKAKNDIFMQKDISPIVEINLSKESSNCAEEKPPMGIFWDIENMRVPKTLSPALLVKNIRARFMATHWVAEFCCACHTKNELASTLDELDFAEVGVYHVRNAKNAADVKLHFLMYRFACTFGSAATIVLISGDTDFEHILDYLRNVYKCYIILVHMSNCPESLVYLANETIPFSQFSSTYPVLTSNPKMNQDTESSELVVWNFERWRRFSVIKEEVIKLSLELSAQTVNIFRHNAILRFQSPSHAISAKKRIATEMSTYGFECRIGRPDKLRLEEERGVVDSEMVKQLENFSRLKVKSDVPRNELLLK